MHDEVILHQPETLTCDRWDADQNRWRHFLLRLNPETKLYEDECETDDIGIPLTPKENSDA